MQANHLEHVRTFLIRYRSGGMPYILRNLRHVPDCGLLSEEVRQRPGDLRALRVACRYSPVGFDRQHLHNSPSEEVCEALISEAFSKSG